MSYGRDCGDFTTSEDLYEELWETASMIVGNAVAIEDTVSAGFQRDTNEYLQRKTRTWEDFSY